MFWNVPACYGMFHVPDFIDALLLPTLPPFGGVLLYYVSIKFRGSLLVVRLSLRGHFPRAFGIACILPSYSFAIILSDPARKALSILLSYPTVVGCFCCAHNLKSLEPATGLCPPPPLLITTSCSYCLI